MKKSGLPRLPFGEGSMSWADDSHSMVHYRKTISVSGKTKRLFVSAQTPAEAMKLMRKKENEAISKLMAGVVKEKDAILADGMRKWLDLFKMQEVNARSFDRIESTYITHIKDSALGKMREDVITSEDIQNFFINLKKHSRKGEILEESSLAYSSRKKIYELLNQYFNNKYIEVPQMNPMRKVPRPRKTDADNEAG